MTLHLRRQKIWDKAILCTLSQIWVIALGTSRPLNNISFACCLYFISTPIWLKEGATDSIPPLPVRQDGFWQGRMCEVPQYRNSAAKALNNIVPWGLDTLNCIPAPENVVYLLKGRGNQLGKICGKAEKKYNSSFQEQLVSVELMFTAFNIPLASFVCKKWHV